MTLWSGRFEGAPDAGVLAHGSSLAVDRRLVDDDLAGSRAWAEALGRANVLDATELKSILEGLDGIGQDVRAKPGLLSEATDEDIHSFVERELTARAGDAGRRLHTGRSRNEQVSLDFRLYLRRRIPDLQRAITDLAAAFVAQAEASDDAVMPSYTHLRRAQPVLVAHLWLAYLAAFRRDVGRFDDAHRAADAMPLGSGAIAGTSYAIDVGWLAKRLGFSRVVSNSIDAAGDRDFVAAFLHACAMTMVHLSRLAEDLILFTSEEFGFFELHDSVATGSSLMPQKKNPDPLELVRGQAGRTIGLLTGWLATMKGLPLGYNKDLQEDKMTAFEAEDTLLGALAVTTTVVRTLAIRVDRARTAASGLLLATDVADYLVRRGVAFRDAHEITGHIVRDLYAADRDFSSLSLEDWQRYSDRFDSDITGAIRPEAALAAKRTPQSTNPSAVSAALAETQAWLKERQG